MLINYVSGEECRIAIVRDDRLEEFYQERASTESHVGNIYKGRVTNVEPSIQAAFIDFGLERNGFLHITDLHPMYFPGKDREEFERVGWKTPHRERPPIQKCLQRGQEILVQVLKEGIGTKGPTLTSYLSIPGRFLVMMPHMQQLGVTRKVEDDDARREAKQMLKELSPPSELGFIVRTAGIGQTKTDLKRDLAYLQRLWKNIERLRKKIGRVGELYTESDLVIRTIRDVFANDISRVIVDDPDAARRAYDFLSIASPRSRSKVVYYDSDVPLFHRFGIEQQIEDIYAREVPLPSGGSLVFDQTEALVAIDVNSGKSRDARDAESNAYNTNKEAIAEITRQLRLRDLGGVIVLDLIDMRDQKNRRSIESKFRQAIRSDRARTRTGSISQFGILELTRQRMRPSLRSSVYNTCEHCHGSGQVKSAESVVLDVMRRLALAMQHEKVVRVDLTISPDVAFQLLNRKRRQLAELERRHAKGVTVRVGGQSVDYVRAAAFDKAGNEIELEVIYRSVTEGKLEEATKELTSERLPGESEPGEPAAAEPEELLEPEQAAAERGEADSDEAGEGDGGKKKRKRRRRGGRSRSKAKAEGTEQEKDQNKDSGQAGEAEQQAGEEKEAAAAGDGDGAGDAEAAAAVEASSSSEAGAAEDSDEKGAKRSTKTPRRRSRGGSRRKAAEEKSEAGAEPGGEGEAEPAGAVAQDGDGASSNGSDEEGGGGGQRRKRRRRGGRKRSRNGDAQAGGEPAEQPSTGRGYSNPLLEKKSE